MKDTDAFLRALKKRGYSVTRTQHNHWRIADSSGGQTIAVHGTTPGNRFALDNLRATIKRFERQQKEAAA